MENDGKMRMFVDPASISTGWAVFEGTEFKASGTIAVDKRLQPFDRLGVLAAEYARLAVLLALDEVHIEQFGGRPSHILHWSVGVIGCALRTAFTKVTQDVPVSSWQSAVDWKGGRGALAGFEVRSEDELAAIGMGLFWTRRFV